MLMSIQPDSDVPIYRQVRDQVVAALVRGELAEGDTLPSVRQLATDLGINLHTVNKAYQLLQDEGYLRIFGRKGARISTQPAYTGDYLAQLRESLSRSYIEALSHGVDAELFRQMVEQAIQENGV